MQSFVFISDPGHGWLVVPLSLVRASGAKISPYSYIRGNMAYLEEDCDAGAFTDTLVAGSFSIIEEHREEFDIRENPAYRTYYLWWAN